MEFGDIDRVVDSILIQLPDFLGLTFEAVCRDWVRLASAAGALPVRVGRVGTWWNSDHEIDVVGLDETLQAAVVGECKWREQPFAWDDLQRYLGHTQALGARLRPDALHLLFSKSGFVDRVVRWAAGTRALLLTPADLLAPFQPAR